MNGVRKSVIAAGAASLLCAFSAFGAVASAATSASVTAKIHAGGVKGDPQPELKPFKFSKVDSSPSSAALEPDGGIVDAYDAPSGTTGETVVCQLSRGGRSCAHRTAIPTPSSMDGVDTSYGPQVQVTSADHVAVLEDVCCDSATDGDTLFYTSTDGGTTFGAPVRIGNVTTGGSVLAGNQIVFIGSDFPQGIQVESVPVSPSGPPATVATLASTRGDVGIGSFHGGVLAGYDFDGTIETTYVDYAPALSNFNSTAAYHQVISIKNEQLVTISGDALLTTQTDPSIKHPKVELRLFNGTSFGSAHAVPGCPIGGPEWLGMTQDPSGRANVFCERAATGYHLIDESTSDGVHWRSANLGNAISSSSFAAAINASHTGLVVGAGGNQAWGYPLLGTQSVKFGLKSSAIKKGKSTVASGSGSPAGVGRVVTLQVERSGRWYSVATTKEKSGGKFSFKIKGKATGKFAYRAVVSDEGGYLKYGYSSAKTLRVTG
jgi:hypothetical protein